MIFHGLYEELPGEVLRQGMNPIGRHEGCLYRASWMSPRSKGAVCGWVLEPYYGPAPDSLPADRARDQREVGS